MKPILTLIIYLIAFSLQAQTFEGFIQNGNKLYHEEKYLESAKEYDKAFGLQKGNSSQYYNAACSWALSGDTINSMRYLNLSVESGWKNLKHIKIDKDLISLHSIKGWEEILGKVQKNLDEYEKYFDKPLKAQLEEIFVRDQTLRHLVKEVEEKLFI